MKQAIEHYENRAGGKGSIHIERLLSKEECGDHIKMYARVVVDVNSSIGYHQHVDDGEAYYILSGKALYTQDNVSQELKPYDIVYCPKLSSHSIENIADEPLVFMALINK